MTEHADVDDGASGQRHFDSSSEPTSGVDAIDERDDARDEGADAGDERNGVGDGGTDAGNEREPVTRSAHDHSWSANLEQPHHADDRDLVIAEAVEAVESTANGYHVNLVTHRNHGHPREYLWPAVDRAVDDVELEYVDQCGCGGHVTRVHVQ